MLSHKVKYGILAFGPPTLFLAGVIPMLYCVLQDPDLRTMPMAGMVGAYIAAAGVVLGIVGFVAYVMHMAKNQSLPSNTRTLWTIGMVAGLVISTGVISVVLAIAYFFLYIVGWNARFGVAATSPTHSHK